MNMTVSQMMAKVSGFFDRLLRIVTVLAWALILCIVTAVLYWLAARVWGFPTFAIRVNAQELTGLGIFVFCAAYALSARR